MPPTELKQTFPERDALEALRVELATIVALVMAAGFLVKRGDVVGVITASGKGRRRPRALATGAGFAVDSAVGRVDDASVFVAGDVLKNAAGTTIGTVLSVDLTTTPDTVTLTGNAAVAVAAGAAVLGSDGSQVAQAIAHDEVDGVGDTNSKVYITGLLKESKLRGLDATAKTELGGVSTVGGVFKF
jgi:hypothetical protein